MKGKRRFLALVRQLGRFAFVPVSEMHRLGQQKPDWLLAVAPTIFCASMQLASATIVARKVIPRLELQVKQLKLASHGLTMVAAVSAINAAASYPILLVTSAMYVVAIDVALHDGKSVKRLAEAAGISMLTQIPNSLVVLSIALTWMPRSESVSSLSVGSLPLLANLGTGLSLLLKISAALSTLWLIVMLGIALRVVAKIHYRSLITAGVFLILVAGSAHFLMARMFAQ